MAIDYTIKDRESFLERMKALIVQMYPNWETDKVAALGNMMFDVFSTMLDKVAYNQDAQANEGFIKVATQISSIIDKAFELGVEIPNRTAATGSVRFSIDTIIDRTVSIDNDNVTVKTLESEPKEFLLLSSGVIPAGSLYVDILAEHSALSSEIKTPEGTADWYTYLSAPEFLEVVSVVDASGFSWTEVDSLIDSETTDRHFEVTVNGQGYGKLQFGDGIMGAVPEDDLTVISKHGGGEDGDVSQGTITVIEGDILDSMGNAVSASVTNPEAFQGGQNMITVKRARRYVPNSFRTQLRTVSNSDYEDNAESVSGVARAVCLTSDDQVGIPENSCHLVVVPDGSGDPSSTLLADVHTMVTVTKPGAPTFVVLTMGPNYKTMDIYAVVYLETGVTNTDARTTIETNLAIFFQVVNDDGSLNDNIKFGAGYKDNAGNSDPYFPYSKVYNNINDSTGIRKLGRVTINGLQGDVLMTYREFPQLGSITLVNGDTNVSF